MAKQFGTTWWGEQWLNSLADIDFGNRLPRGARYARNGSVKQIEIKDGKIEARVQGSRRTPYKEVIQVPQFDSARAKRFVDRLASNPLMVASLVQRKLDPEVLKIAKEEGLKVFPSSWQDLPMKCSCPDWAVPCKHLAAVIYKVSEEIDSNPFLVFELHGLDLFKELEKRGVLSPDLSANLNPLPIEDLMELSEDVEPGKDWKAPEIDFSRLPEIGDDLLELLRDNPAFSINGNFKKTYAKAIGSIAKGASKTLMSAYGRDTAMEVFAPGTDIRIAIGKDYRMKVTLTDGEDKEETLSFAQFTSRLGEVRPESYPLCEPWVETMHRLWLLGVNLVMRRDIVPRIVRVGKEYRSLWQPALLQTYIKEVSEEVSECVPVSVGIDRGKKRACLSNSGEWLLWNILSEIVARQGREVQLPSGDELYDLFFLDDPQRFDAIGHGGVAGGIRVWTEPFFMLEGKTGEIALYVGEKGKNFTVDLSVATSQDRTEAGRHIPFHKFMDSEEPGARKLEVVSRLAALTDYLPGLREYVMANGKKGMVFDSASFVPFLFRIIPLMRLLGVEVILPKSLQEIIKPKVSVKIDSKETDGKTYIRLDELLTFDWEVALGEDLVSVEEYRSLMLKAGELVKFKGRYIYASPQDLDKLGRQLEKGGKMSSQEMLAVALSGSYKDAPVKITEACRELLNKFRQRPDLPVPEGLQAELRPYQQRGYEWMMHNLSLGFGAIIADDMGLGKTLQVISVMLKLKEDGAFEKRRALVVVPTGLLANWQKECARFAPDLKVGVYHGPSRDLRKVKKEVVLTSYGVLRSDVAKLKKMKWELLVIDEAQNIKNTATAQTKAVTSIPARSYIAMSGTPVENRLSEFWSIMNFANKGLLGTLKEFNTQYGRPIQLEGSRQAIDQFKALTAPFMLRRLKSDKTIISDLPDKIERDEYAPMTADQSALYQEALNSAMREIEGVTGQDHHSLFKREGLVLQMIMALKQICNHPAQFLKTGQADAALSGKSELLLDIVGGIVEAGEKVLIFTQFREMGELLAEMLREANISSMFYHGGTPLRKREEMVERFQTQRSAQVFILSLKAAGTGLNLTAATNVIHYDLWWNPAVEAQATDRAYRIGQHRNVQVYRFITKGTFEEKINAMIQDKKELADLTVGTGEKWLAAMSDTELRELFSLG